MTELPSGTVTFLFTDIEGSTRSARELGDRYAPALAEHRRILRAAIASHGGSEVDTQGDAFLAAFDRASSAVAAAEEAQRGLARQPLRVRMGIHTGEPGRTEDGYVGIDLTRGARICAAGHGGQVLLSEATRKLLDHDVPLQDLGEHRLKDLIRPERLFQLVIVGLDSAFPALKTLAGPPTSLPAQLTPLVGREFELREVARAVHTEGIRLLSLTGPGGVGKTRLALAMADWVRGDFPDGVFFVPLAAIRDPGLVPSTILRALGLRESPGRTSAEILIGFLLFARLSTFVGGFTLEAAEAICEADLDALSSLLDKSLIRRDADRYVMLETTREYGLGQLAASHESDRIRSRRTSWYTDFAQRGEREIRGTGGAAAGQRFEAEHDNLRAILRELADEGDAVGCLTLATSLVAFWYEHGYLSEGLGWLNEALSKTDPAPTSKRARALNRAGALAIRYGDAAQARSHLEESLRVARDVGDDAVAASANSNLGTVALAARDYGAAASRYEDANAFFFATPGYDLDSAICLDHIATLELLQGHLTRADELCAQGLALCRKIGNDAQIACTLHTAAMTHLAQGDVRGAVASLTEALDRAHRVGDVAKTVAVVEGFAAVSVATGLWERAACLFGFADAYRASRHLSDPVTRGLVQPFIDQLRTSMSSEPLAKCWSEGRSLTLDGALTMARRAIELA